MRIQKTQSGSHRHILRRVGGLKALSVALLVSLPACGSYEGDTDLGDDLSQVEQDLFADSSWLFMPTGTSSTTQIAMCWTSSAFGSGANAAKFQTRRQVTEQAIADTWEAHSWINVTWYSGSSCPSGAIPVEVDEGTPRADPSKMTLNFTFNSWSSSACGTSDAARDSCVHANAVHEFGHVLGFDHEHNRDANGQPCPGGRVYPDVGNFTVKGDWGLGEEDLESVMSYCNSWSGTLSDGDIAGLRAVYGGDAAHIDHGSRVALRRSNGKFFRDDGAASDDYSKSHSRLRIRRVGSSSGSVRYNDKVTIQSVNSSKYFCGQRGFSPGPGHNGPGFYSPPQTVWKSSLDADCEWTVQHSSGSAGGSKVDVNDPFDLYMKLTARPREGVTEHTFEQDITKLRMLQILLDMGS